VKLVPFPVLFIAKIFILRNAAYVEVRGAMNGDTGFLLLLVAGGLSIWLTILLVLLCGRVKAIKSMLMAVYDFEEHKGFFGSTYHRRPRFLTAEENSNRGADFLKPRS
jgi:hypothetical protein